MTLFIASLNSGSNGNCYYIGNQDEAVLIDAGLSCRETERRMQRMGLPLSRVRAIFISHEHDDHIRGLEVLSQRYQLPVYITQPTLDQCRLPPSPDLVRAFDPAGTVVIGGLAIKALPKNHDASDPYSFTVASPTVCIGIFTDIGVVCDNLIRHFSQCHAAFLEANYDELLLEKGRYPWPLKNRIRGGQGHLSNRQALELFADYRPAFMSHLLLAHLSQDNNRPELVQQLFEEASREQRSSSPRDTTNRRCMPSTAPIAAQPAPPGHRKAAADPPGRSPGPRSQQSPEPPPPRNQPWPPREQRRTRRRQAPRPAAARP